MSAARGGYAHARGMDKLARVRGAPVVPAAVVVAVLRAVLDVLAGPVGHGLLTHVVVFAHASALVHVFVASVIVFAHVGVIADMVIVALTLAVADLSHARACGQPLDELTVRSLVSHAPRASPIVVGVAVEYIRPLTVAVVLG